jgi:arylsulfatase A-like enzyme
VSKWEEKAQRDQVAAYLMTGRDTLSPKDLREWETLYDERLAYLDRKVGQLLSFLRSNDLDRNTVVIITSDHGDHLGEHHLTGHQYSLYETVIQVPLIVRWDAHFQVGEDNNCVQNHDVYATILDAAAVPWQRTPAHNSESLLRLGNGKPRACFSEYLSPYVPLVGEYSAKYPTLDFGRFLRKLRSVRLGDMKLIRSSDGTFELYNLAKDPFESRNLAATDPQTVRKLQKVLNDWLQSFEHYEPATITPEDIKGLSPEELNNLRGLGYIR